MIRKIETDAESSSGIGGSIAGCLAECLAGIVSCAFPRVCPICGDLLTQDDGLAHRACLDKLSFVKAPVCARCGKQIITPGQRLCYDCTHHERHIIRNFPTLNYDDTSRRIITSLKYHNYRQYAQFLGRLMAYKNKEKIEGVNIDCIVPVPISKSRYRERRYNQAELIANVLGEELSIPVYPKILVRKKKTKALKDLGADSRLEEMKDAIEIGELPEESRMSGAACRAEDTRGDMNGMCESAGAISKMRDGVCESDGAIRRVLIVDDIYTTGATIEACACALRSAGIESYSACACIGSDY